MRPEYLQEEEAPVEAETLQAELIGLAALMLKRATVPASQIFKADHGMRQQDLISSSLNLQEMTKFKGQRASS